MTVLLEFKITEYPNENHEKFNHQGLVSFLTVANVFVLNLDI